MKKLIFVTVLTFSLFGIFGASASSAQIERRLTSTPKDFQAFFAKFKRAVIRGDKQGVASLTRFPFEYSWDAGDDGTYSRAQFIRKYSLIFDGGKKLFSQRNPMIYSEGKSFNLTNYDDASHYLFEKKGGTYKFVSIVSEP